MKKQIIADMKKISTPNNDKYYFWYLEVTCFSYIKQCKLLYILQTIPNTVQYNNNMEVYRSPPTTILG